MESRKMLLPYKQLCSEKKWKRRLYKLKRDDVPVAISNEVSKSQISMLVIGASSVAVSQGVLYEVKYYLKHNQLYIISEHFIFLFFFI
ncbi:hypothetical protein Scep_010278 [Stephania cephalantha]|uniref:Uncharacterized protein n=1 Tax=Stephania cephalantha TaxID=152367 RepID=A0AAP0JX74_9MAGN